MLRITNMLRLLFPERKAHALLALHTPASFAHLYRPHMVADVTVLATYRNPLIRAAITELKFHHNGHAAQLLGALLGRWLHEQTMPHAVLIPMPLSTARKRDRGFNQVARIIAACPQPHPYAMNDRILCRARHTKPQTSLQRDERATNVKDAFTVTDPDLIRGAHLVLIDDVYTTGATMKAACAALNAHDPASLTCVALAH